MTLEDEGRVVKLLIRDSDAKFVGPFNEVISPIGALVIKTPFRAPRVNAFAERFVGTARRELTFENSDLVAEHRQFDIIVAFGSLARIAKDPGPGRVRWSRG